MSTSIHTLLSEARTGLERLTPAEAYRAMNEGALLIDIRPVAQRVTQGEVPGAVVIDRNVLEWRLDPASDAKLPIATGYDIYPMVLCSEGYASSLAAATLQAIGLRRATDVIGGFKAWRAAGLPSTGGRDVATAPEYREPDGASSR